MREALAMANKAYTENEVPVGCVFVHNDQIIARGMNNTNESLNATQHAEFNAIGTLDSLEILKESDLYVTVEPCIMCAAALRQVEIRHVYFGCSNEKFGGCGTVFNIHNDKSRYPEYKVTGGILKNEAIMMLRKFYIKENSNAPEPRKKTNRVLKPVSPDR